MLELIHWVALVVASAAALIYFRDLGDITQAFMKVKRKNMIFAIRHERVLVLTALIGNAIAWATTFFYGAGIAILAYVLVAINIFEALFPYIWLHVGLRNQQNRAKYYSIEEAKAYPEGKVFLNKIVPFKKNPFMWLFDL